MAFRNPFQQGLKKDRNQKSRGIAFSQPSASPQPTLSQPSTPAPQPTLKEPAFSQPSASRALQPLSQPSEKFPNKKKKTHKFLWRWWPRFCFWELFEIYIQNAELIR